MFKNLHLFVLAISLFGCTFPKMPQSSTEFINLAATNNSIKTSNTKLNKPLNQIAPELHKKMSKCFNFDSTWTRSEGGMVKGSFTEQYRVNVTRQSAREVEMAIQAEPLGNRIGPEMPKGGFYRVVLVLKAESKNTTKLTVYSAGWDEADAAITNWAKDQKHECPVKY